MPCGGGSPVARDAPVLHGARCRLTPGWAARWQFVELVRVAPALAAADNERRVLYMQAVDAFVKLCTAIHADLDAQKTCA